MKDLIVRFNLSDDKYITAVRLVAGAVCALAETDVEAANDFKVSVTEGVIMLRNSGCEEVEIAFSCEGGVNASVTGFGGTPHAAENDFSVTLLSALLSGFDMEEKDGVVKRLLLRL
ncbi:MAG: hypothetical protein LUD29_03810 [Clostridia bacterium]|nr:hypothetical protein [Clostridia bacterium]